MKMRGDFEADNFPKVMTVTGAMELVSVRGQPSHLTRDRRPSAASVAERAIQYAVRVRGAGGCGRLSCRGWRHDGAELRKQSKRVEVGPTFDAFFTVEMQERHAGCLVGFSGGGDSPV